MSWNSFFIQGHHWKLLNIWQKYEKKLILLSFVQVPWMMPLLHLQEERFANASFIETEFYLIFS